MCLLGERNVCGGGYKIPSHQSWEKATAKTAAFIHRMQSLEGDRVLTSLICHGHAKNKMLTNESYVL